MATKKEPVIKVEPVKIGEDVYKINDINEDQKTAIMNAVMETEGNPTWDLFVKVLKINGFKTEETLYWDIETTTSVGNAIINCCNTKKKKK